MPLDAVRDKLGLVLPHVTPLAFIGPLEADTEAEYDGLVEEEPAGSSLEIGRIARDVRRAISIAIRIGWKLDDIHEHKVGLGGLRPSLVYADDADEITAIAPRSELFLATASTPDHGVAYNWDHCYLAPEVLAQSKSRPPADADVFSLCAALAHWVTGEHPFVGEGPMQAISIAVGQRRPWNGPPELESIVAQGLKVDPRERPLAIEVIAALQQVQDALAAK